MKRLVILAVLLSGCTVSFQPFPSVTQKEFKAAMEAAAKNDQILASKLSELQKGKK